MEADCDLPQFQHTRCDAPDRYDLVQLITVSSMFSLRMVSSSTGVCRVSNAADMSKE